MKAIIDNLKQTITRKTKMSIYHWKENDLYYKYSDGSVKKDESYGLRRILHEELRSVQKGFHATVKKNIKLYGYIHYSHIETLSSFDDREIIGSFFYTDGTVCDEGIIQDTYYLNERLKKVEETNFSKPYIILTKDNHLIDNNYFNFHREVLYMINKFKRCFGRDVSVKMDVRYYLGNSECHIEPSYINLFALYGDIKKHSGYDAGDSPEIHDDNVSDNVSEIDSDLSVISSPEEDFF